MDISDTNILEPLSEYAGKFTAPESPLLQKINRETHLRSHQAQMLSGHLQGRFLSLISRWIQPKRILEIGTFTGYSALCLAEGLRPEGVLHTIDNNDELRETCLGYFKESEFKDHIKLHTGDAIELLPTLDGPFDLVFIDADKPNYSNYFDLVIEKVRKGGFILADNVLYHGEVLADAAKQSKNGKAIVAFNEKVSKDKRVRPLLLPIRDGIFILEKL